MHPGHVSPNQWDARTPTDLHRLLFAACLEPLDVAEQAWREWLAKCNFDFEDPASIELAALAVSRLGAAAGESSEASRCRGWNRRAWFLSEFALEVAEALCEASDRRGLGSVAVGDLATHVGGYRFAGRPFPVRRVEFAVPGARRSDLEALRQVPLSESAAKIIRSRTIALVIGRGSDWSAANTRRAAGSIRIPDAGAHIARLASSNWQLHPPGYLRWILEILAVLHDAPEPAELGPAVVEAAHREGMTAEVGAALHLVGTVPGGEAAAPIILALEHASARPLSRLRQSAIKQYRGWRR
jgi:hypothetical protein